MKTKKLTTEEFNALPRKEKAVLVAEDIIKQIDKKVLRPRHQGYVNLPRKAKYPNVILQDVKSHPEMIQGCTVCAIGAAIVCTTLLANKLSFLDLNSFSDNEKAIKLLKQVFSPKQIMLIEYAYEGWNYWMPAGIAEGNFNIRMTEEMVEKTMRFSNKYKQPGKRLKAIAENIIINKGIFKP